VPFSDDDLEAFYREIEQRTDERRSGRPVRPEPSKSQDINGRQPESSSFTDAELENFYRAIEARTAATPARKRRRAGVSKAAPPRSCPTPDKVAFASDVLARESIVAVRRHTGSGPTLRCYRCVCGAWHITSKLRP
jgi:hypothetical protein